MIKMIIRLLKVYCWHLLLLPCLHVLFMSVLSWHSCHWQVTGNRWWAAWYIVLDLYN